MFDNKKIEIRFLLLKTINRMFLDNIFKIILSYFFRAILKIIIKIWGMIKKIKHYK